MADRYWVGGNGTWNTTTTNWSATSGGAGGASAPTSADDVFFDANSASGSYSVTFTTTTVSARSISVDKPASGTIAWTGNTGNTISLSGNFTVLTDAANFTTNSNIALNIVGNTSFQANGANLGSHRLLCNTANISFTLANTLTVGKFDYYRGNIVLNGYDLYTSFFEGFNADFKGYSFGSNAIYIYGSNSNVFIYATQSNSNVTVSGTPRFVFTYTGSEGTRNILANAQSISPQIESLRFYFTGNATDTVTFNTGAIHSVDFSNFAGNFNVQGNLTLVGNLVLNPGVTQTANGNLFLGASSGATTNVAILYGNGATWAGNVNDNGNGTVRLGSNFTIASNRSYTHGNGELDLNGYSLSAGNFVSNSNNIRSLNFSNGGNITVTTPSTLTAFDMTNIGNLTVTGNFVVNYDNPNQPVGNIANLLMSTAVSDSQLASFNIKSGNGTIRFNGIRVKDVDFTGFTGTWANVAKTITGNLILSPGMTVGNLAILTGVTFAGNTDSYLTSNGVNFTSGITIAKNDTSKQLILVDDLTIGYGNVATHGISIVSGGFDPNNKNLTTGVFIANGTNVRSWTVGTGTYTVNANVSTALVEMREMSNLTVTGKPTFTIGTVSANANAFNINLGNSWTQDTAPNVVFNNLGVGSNANANYLFTGMVDNIDMTNMDGVFAVSTGSANSLYYYGNTLTMGSNTKTTGTSGNIVFGGNREQTIETNGKAIPTGIIIDKTDNSNIILLSNTIVNATVITSKTVFLNNGGMNLNGFNLSNVFSFNSNGSTQRRIDFGSTGLIDISSASSQNDYTPWSTEGANLTVTGSKNVWVKPNLSSFGNIATVTTSPNVDQSNAFNFISNTPLSTGTLRFGNASNTDVFGTINVNGSGAGRVRHGNIVVYGDYIKDSTGTTVINTGDTILLTGTADQTFNANIYNYYPTIIVDKTGGNLTFTQGLFSSPYGSDLAVHIYGGNVILNTAPYLSYFKVFGNTTQSNLIMNRDIVINQGATANGNLYFNPDGNIVVTRNNGYISLEYGNVDFYTANRDFGNTPIYIGFSSGGSNTTIFGNLTTTGEFGISSTNKNFTQDRTITFESGKTYTFSNVSLNSSNGTMTLKSSTAGSPHYLVYTGSGNVQVYNTTITDSSASPSDTWYALLTNNNTDGGNNLGWIFGNAPPLTNFYQMMAMFR